MSAHRLLAAAPDDISADIIGVLEELAALPPQHAQWRERQVHAALVLAAEARVLLARLAGEEDRDAVAALGVERAVIERHRQLCEIDYAGDAMAREALWAEVERVRCIFGGDELSALWHIAGEQVAMEREAGS